MLVDQWVGTVWAVLNVREKTLRDYKHLYKNRLNPVIVLPEMDSVLVKDLQVRLLSLPPQTH